MTMSPPPGEVIPILIQRANNLGWFASTPETYPLRFAVEGTTEEEARANFAKSLAHWEAIGEGDRPVKRRQS